MGEKWNDFRKRLKINIDGEFVPIGGIEDFSHYFISENSKQKFHIYDTVKHDRYGIGTVIDFDYYGNPIVDFDNDNPLLKEEHIGNCLPFEMTLVKAYILGGEND